MVLECKHVWDHISGYLDGTLDTKLLDEVQRHLEHCEICSKRSPHGSRRQAANQTARAAT